MPEPKRRRVRLNKQFCETATAPSSGNKLFRCGDTRGFALRVTAKGHRSFVFCYSAPDGRERRMTVGEFGAWTVPAARKRCEELRRLLDQGHDPLAARVERRNALTLRGLFHWYSENYLGRLSPASRRDITARWQNDIEPRLGARKALASLTKADVQSMVDGISERSGPIAGNRAHSYLRRMLNLAVGEGFVNDNVAASHIHRNPEHPRERYLTETEIGRLLDVIEGHPDRLPALAIKLLILTGARRTEVLAMQWDEVDLAAGVWTKSASRTKQKRQHRVPLSGEAVATLVKIKAMGGDSPFVFPSHSRQGHIVDVKRAWEWLKEEADIQECRIHDLRHTYASVIASNGGSLEVIGALLGHSQVQTTKRYAHLFDNSLRSATEIVGSLSRR